jgi:hypothetical protein
MGVRMVRIAVLVAAVFALMLVAVPGAVAQDNGDNGYPDDGLGPDDRDVRPAPDDRRADDHRRVADRELARTGFPISRAAMAGAVIVVAGGTVLLMTRRREDSEVS